MLTQDFEKALLSLLCWREARGDGLEAMLAVALVCRNRVNTWKKSWCEVIEGHWQFSSMTCLGDSQTVVYPDCRDPLFLKMLQNIDSVYDGSAKDITNDALYYANLASMSSKWFKKNIVENSTDHPMTCVIGQQHFFS